MFCVLCEARGLMQKKQPLACSFAALEVSIERLGSAERISPNIIDRLKVGYRKTGV